MTTQTKQLRFEIKDATKGEVEAVFSTFGVIDHDGDVTMTGAFEDGAAVKISAYGHASWGGFAAAALPVGRGTIRTSEKDARLLGQFFLATDAGREHFELIKAMGELQEWSYGFDVIDAEMGEQDDQSVRFLKKLKVHEVSPVLVGAGIDTRTVAVKGEGATQLELEASATNQAITLAKAAAASEYLRFMRTGARLRSLRVA